MIALSRRIERVGRQAWRAINGDPVFFPHISQRRRPQHRHLEHKRLTVDGLAPLRLDFKNRCRADAERTAWTFRGPKLVDYTHLVDARVCGCARRDRVAQSIGSRDVHVILHPLNQPDLAATQNHVHGHRYTRIDGLCQGRYRDHWRLSVTHHSDDAQQAEIGYIPSKTVCTGKVQVQAPIMQHIERSSGPFQYLEAGSGSRHIVGLKR